MRNIIKPILLLALLFLTVSCGTSYTVPRAILHVDFHNPNDIGEIRRDIIDFLKTKEFLDLGKDEEMLKLLERNHSQSEISSKSNQLLIDRIHRTINLSNKSLSIDVVLIDYSDTQVKKRYANYPDSLLQVTDLPSIEINIYNFRPGGFSNEGHLFFEVFYSMLQSKYGDKALIIVAPPETDEAEYYKTKISNLLASVFVWLFVYTLAIAIFGVPLILLLNRIKLSVWSKRMIFTVFGATLATPLPFQAAFILVVSLPSVFALPAIGTDYFYRIMDYAVPSFVISCIFCYIISIRFIKENNDDNI